MKRTLLLHTLLICITSLLHAQAPLVKQWDKCFGGTDDERLFQLQQTNDGGYLLSGASFSGSGGDRTQPSWGYADFWVVKIDSLGNKQWDKRYGGNWSDYLTSVQQTIDGGYILGGSSSSDSTGDKTQPKWGFRDDFWIVKIDSLGNKQWDKRYGGTDEDYLRALQQTSDGGYILGGGSGSDINGDKTEPNWDQTFESDDYWIVKIDALGNKQWDKRFGGTEAEEFSTLLQTNDGGYILGGNSYSEISGEKTQPSQGLSDYWIVKTDSLGNKQWDKRYGGNDGEWLYSLLETTDGGYILGGSSGSILSGDRTEPNRNPTFPGSRDYWIVKIDALGNKQWDKRFGGVYDDGGLGIFGNLSQTSDGGYLMAGSSKSPAGGDKSEENLGIDQTWIVKTDFLGNKQWDKTIFTTGREETGLAIQTNDGCYVIANYTEGGIGGDKTEPNRDPNTIGTTTDYWMIKLCDSTVINSVMNDEKSLHQISIYPNPVSTIVTIEAANIRGLITAYIHDAFGRQLYNQIIDGSQLSQGFGIDLSNLPPNIYFLRFQSESGSRVMKVVKY